MTNELQHRNSSTSIRSIPLRSAWTALAVGTLLLSAVTPARSQDEKAPKPPTYNVLYTFTGGADGANPNVPGKGAGLIRDGEGNLYGTTTSGGDLSCSLGSGFGCGVVFKLDCAGKETVLHTFTGPDGVNPVASLIRDEEGNLYGTAVAGGSSAGGGGTVFRLDRAGKETVLYSFTGGADGSAPYGVIRDEKGNLYGTTQYGGASNDGVVYRLDRTRKETLLHTFTGTPDGVNPTGGLIRDEEGNLYGATTRGGTAGIGLVFKLDPTGQETVLYSFAGGADGAYPEGGLVRDEVGTIYGTTAIGGAFNNGVVFRLDRSGKETVLYTFTGGTDGAFPYGSLFLGAGYLYGTTFFGGDLTSPELDCSGTGCGVVFKLDQAGTETVLYTFTGAADGANPYVGLLQDEEGNFYGTTGYGGDLTSPQPLCTGFGCGVVFKLKPW
jgi:uncharacterized repeat protein (TIGR03803 family)